MTSHTGNSAPRVNHREGRRKFTAKTPRDELREEDLVAMESFRLQSLQGKAGLVSGLGMAGSGQPIQTSSRTSPDIGEAVEPSSSVPIYRREVETSPHFANTPEDHAQGNPSLTRNIVSDSHSDHLDTIFDPSTTSSDPKVSGSSNDNLLDECPCVVLFQIPHKALEPLKGALENEQYLKEFDWDAGDSEELIIGYSIDKASWDKVTDACSINVLPKKRTVKLTISFDGIPSAVLSLNVQVTGTLVLASFALGLVVMVTICMGLFNGLPYYYLDSYDYASGIVALKACIFACLRTCQFYLLKGITTFPSQMKGFIRSAPVRTHRLVNRSLQSLLLWALKELAAQPRRFSAYYICNLLPSPKKPLAPILFKRPLGVPGGSQSLPMKTTRSTQAARPLLESMRIRAFSYPAHRSSVTEDHAAFYTGLRKPHANGTAEKCRSKYRSSQPITLKSDCIVWILARGVISVTDLITSGMLR
ncbi:hypothetical protein FA13DRAFT_1709526 [Coprinellus micaceus]|uniref:Uncharacterized protein n=1 Tax=Coprinellus micaceus TaxID=71717 RepID=A0A4Y7TBL4_COPMI|nr:hypothetical protein FA13DRAFT_1709526 [Coprinellus micaceus]